MEIPFIFIVFTSTLIHLLLILKYQISLSKYLLMDVFFMLLFSAFAVLNVSSKIGRQGHVLYFCSLQSFTLCH